MSLMSISILMPTYDRFSQYIDCLYSIRPAIYPGSKVDLFIGVDSKLPNWKFQLKKYLTAHILGDCQYSFIKGKDCVGKTRNYLISQSNSEYFINLDDDDLLDAKNLLRIADKLYWTHPALKPDIFNFDFYARTGDLIENTYAKGAWTVKDWFDDYDIGISIGQNSIFKRSLYENLDSKYHYWRSYIDDMLPNHAMYLKALHISKLDNFTIIKRNRGDESLMLTTNLQKYIDVVRSLEEFRRLLYKDSTTVGQHKDEFWRITLSNQITYHKMKSGDDFGRLIHGYFQYQRLL